MWLYSLLPCSLVLMVEVVSAAFPAACATHRHVTQPVQSSGILREEMRALSVVADLVHEPALAYREASASEIYTAIGLSFAIDPLSLTDFHILPSLSSGFVSFIHTDLHKFGNGTDLESATEPLVPYMAPIPTVTGAEAVVVLLLLQPTPLLIEHHFLRDFRKMRQHQGAREGYNFREFLKGSNLDNLLANDTFIIVVFGCAGLGAGTRSPHSTLVTKTVTVTHTVSHSLRSTNFDAFTTATGIAATSTILPISSAVSGSGISSWPLSTLPVISFTTRLTFTMSKFTASSPTTTSKSFSTAEVSLVTLTIIPPAPTPASVGSNTATTTSAIASSSASGGGTLHSKVASLRPSSAPSVLMAVLSSVFLLRLPGF